MRNKAFQSTILLISLCLAFLTSSAQSTQKDSFYLYFLGGQSNMDGYGYNKDLPADLNQKFEKVWIFHGNTLPDGKAGGGQGHWDQLKAGHGVGFSATSNQNNRSERFGIELSFARKIQERYPDRKIALIKYSRGGTSIDCTAGGGFGCWDPDYNEKDGINQYDHFLATLRNAFSVQDLDFNGQKDVLIPKGIIWMQGEADATVDEGVAGTYAHNLKRLMDLIRASLWTDDLPVVIGKITDSNNSSNGLVWKYGDLVRQQQEDFVRKDNNAAIVRSTEHYGYSDPWHYDSAGYIDLGEKFAEAVIMLQGK
jgi:hypothetical protein